MSILTRSKLSQVGGWAIMVAFVGLISASPVDAAINSDITTTGIFVVYDAQADTLYATTKADPNPVTQGIDRDGVTGPEDFIYNSYFDVFVTIDDLGNVTGGSLYIGGAYNDPTPGAPTSLLVTSTTLSSASYDLGGVGTFVLLFDNVTSSLPGFGSQVTVKLNAGFDGFTNPVDFSTDFGNGFFPDPTVDLESGAVAAALLGGAPFGTADTIASVPEPTSLAIWALTALVTTCAGLCRTRRNR